MKIWVDDIRPAPEGYNIWCRSVRQAISILSIASERVELLDLDHDAGEFAADGGDYIRILDWLEEKQKNVPIRIHSMNPVGRQNMLAIIQKNGWRVVF